MLKKIILWISKHKAQFILICILFLSLLTRTIFLNSVPPALNQDEAVSGYDAYTLGINLRDHHGNYFPVMLQSFNDWASPLLTYLTIPFVKVFGLSIFSIRLTIALFGVFSIYLLYKLLVHLFKRKSIALLGAFLLAISPWHITLTRWAIPPGIVPFCLLLFLCTFFWSINKQKNDGSIWQYVIPGITGGLLTYSYPTQKLFAPLFILALVIIYIKNHFKSFLILLTVFVIFISPIYILTFSDQKYNARFNDVSSISNPNAKKEIISRYFNYFLPDFQFQTGDKDMMHQVPGTGNSYGFLSIFFYLGIIICILGSVKLITIKNVDSKTYQMLLAWLFLFPIAAALTKDNNMVLRVVHGLPLVVIFFTLTCSYIFSKVNKKIVNIFIIFIVLIGIFNFGKFSLFYFKKYPDLVFVQYQYGIHEFMSFLQENEGRYDEVIIDSNINQPYIYYLFFNAFDPKNLNYSDPKQSLPKYVFGTVSIGLDFTELYSINYKDKPRYSIYSKNSTWYVKSY